MGERVGQICDVVGETPLIFIKSLSLLTGCEIFGKAEFLNPAGSVKDRAAKSIIETAEKEGRLKSGDTIVEGTAGNTGIALAMLARERGYKALIVMPDNQADEKYQTLRALGAEIHAVKPVPFKDPGHFYHQARRIAETTPHSFWANQFENTDNLEAHYRTTGPEIWSQMQGQIDVACMAAGTGGTIGGVSRFLKEKNPAIQVVLADPMGSGLYEYIKNGEIKTEGSSIIEGIGIMRLTENFKSARIDQTLRISDQQMIEMLYHLASHDGLLVGPSAALNVRACYELAKQNRRSGKRFVTILCDHASRYQSRLFNDEWLKMNHLNVHSPLD